MVEKFLWRTPWKCNTDRLYRPDLRPRSNARNDRPCLLWCHTVGLENLYLFLQARSRCHEQGPEVDEIVLMISMVSSEGEVMAFG